MHPEDCEPNHQQSAGMSARAGSPRFLHNFEVTLPKIICIPRGHPAEEADNKSNFQRKLGSNLIFRKHGSPGCTIFLQ